MIIQYDTLRLASQEGEYGGNIDEKEISCHIYCNVVGFVIVIGGLSYEQYATSESRLA